MRHEHPFGLWLRRALNERNMSVVDLQIAVCSSETESRRWVSGERAPYTHWKNIIRALHVRKPFTKEQVEHVSDMLGVHRGNFYTRAGVDE